ncbi:30S ribosomal protein S9 [Candidatus Kaiserbacteria bacterium]|nr:30S ribosomal protein S9 [Candidatus Kaiserbacteria bacterium]
MPSKQFITAVGRRKTAIASVRMLKAAKGSVKVNGKSAKDYFKTSERAKVAEEALAIASAGGGSASGGEHYEVHAHVSGGGISAQADAVRHAISRALIKAEPNTRKALKAAGFLKRDPRAKERKKPGLKKARKAPQWSKR